MGGVNPTVNRSDEPPPISQPAPTPVYQNTGAGYEPGSANYAAPGSAGNPVSAEHPSGYLASLPTEAKWWADQLAARANPSGSTISPTGLVNAPKAAYESASDPGRYQYLAVRDAAGNITGYTTNYAFGIGGIVGQNIQRDMVTAYTQEQQARQTAQQIAILPQIAAPTIGAPEQYMDRLALLEMKSALSSQLYQKQATNPTDSEWGLRSAQTALAARNAIIGQEMSLAKAQLAQSKIAWSAYNQYEAVRTGQISAQGTAVKEAMGYAAQRQAAEGTYSKVVALAGVSDALYMAQEAARTGTTIDPYVAAKAAEQGFVGVLNVGSLEASRSTVPVRDYTTYVAPPTGAIIKQEAAYYPYGAGKVEVFGKTFVDPVSGKVSTVEQIPGRNITNLIGGGGDYSAQSGAISVGKPDSAVVYTRDFALYPEGDVRGISPASASNWREVLASPEKYSTGGELYRGMYGTLLDSRTIEGVRQASGFINEPSTVRGSFPLDSGILATYVTNRDYVKTHRPDVVPVSVENFASAPALNIWRDDLWNRDIGKYGRFVSAESLPTEQRFGYTDAIVKSTIPSVQNVSVSVPSNVLGMGAGVYATTPEGWERAIVEGAIPKPFMSDYSTPTVVTPPSGDVLGYQIPVVSSVLAFFSPGKSVTTTQSSRNLPEVTTLKETTTTPVEGGVLTTNIYETTGGKEISTVTNTKSTPSGFDVFEQSIRDVLPPVEAGERAVQLASLSNPYLMPHIVSGKITEKLTEIVDPSRLEEVRSNASLVESLVGLRGQYTMLYEHPTSTVVSTVLGVVFGTAARSIGGIQTYGRVAAAEKIISEGGMWRAADLYVGTVSKYAPVALATVYGADVASRSTEGFTNFEPANVVPAAKGIVMQEAVPMGIGFGVPDRVVTSARVSDIGYKSALQEGTTTGRFDYYVKQPVVQPITSKYELFKLEYPEFQEAAGGNKIGSAARYIEYKTGFDRAPQPEIVRQTISPEMEFSTGNVYGKQPTIPEYIMEVANTRVTPEVSRDYIEPVGIEKTAYGKQPNAFDFMDRPYSPEVSRNYFETPENKYIEASEPLGIKIKSYLQEHPLPISESARAESLIKVVRPVGEISRRNAISDFNRQPFTGETPSSVVSTGTTPPSTGRIVTKIVGGKEVSGLSSEPSLKSMGITETVGKTEFPFKESVSSRSVDYRGSRPQQMKPMYDIKQNAGVTAIQEQLPAIESVVSTTPAEKPLQNQFIPSLFKIQPSSKTDYEVIQVQEPEKKTSVEQVFAIEPSFGITPESLQEIVTIQPQMQTTEQVQTIVPEVIGREITPEINQIVAPVQQQIPSYVFRTYSSLVTPFVMPTQSILSSPAIVPTQSQRYTPQLQSTTYFEPKPTITTTTGLLPPFGQLPPGMGAAQSRKRGKRKFTEIFNVGLDLATFGKDAYNWGGGKPGGWAKPRRSSTKKPGLKKTRKK